MKNIDTTSSITLHHDGIDYKSRSRKQFSGIETLWEFFLFFFEFIVRSMVDSLSFGMTVGTRVIDLISVDQEGEKSHAFSHRILLLIYSRMLFKCSSSLQKVGIGDCRLKIIAHFPKIFASLLAQTGFWICSTLSSPHLENRTIGCGRWYHAPREYVHASWAHRYQSVKAEKTLAGDLRQTMRCYARLLLKRLMNKKVK